MRQTLAILALASACFAFPQQDLQGLINTALHSTTELPDNLNNLIGEVFGKPNNTNGGTILGIQNTPPPTDTDCKCVPYYQCRDGTILDNGVGLIDIRSGFTENDKQVQEALGPCENYLDVCCKPPDVVKPDEKLQPKPTQRKGCGERHPQGVGFRITGQVDGEAQFGEFPWMVAILKEELIGGDDQKVNVYQCGGALIHRKAVLTAAHCVNGKQASELKIRAGEWDTQTKNEIYPHQDREVETVIVHENFHSGALYNDVAILILKEPVNYEENVDVVCLPPSGTIFDESRCFASGWGKDMFGKEGHYQVILKRVELPVVNRGKCQESLRKTRLGSYFVLNDSFICAGGEAGKDTCKGDGGSPLVCPLKNDPTRYAQAGIVAWGIGCGENQTPGVYANVAYARNWIDEQMVYNNLGTKSYEYGPSPL